MAALRDSTCPSMGMVMRMSAMMNEVQRTMISTMNFHAATPKSHQLASSPHGAVRMLLTAALSLLSLSACSLMTDFDPEGKPCDSYQKCEDGYYCQVTNQETGEGTCKSGGGAAANSLIAQPVPDELASETAKSHVSASGNEGGESTSEMESAANSDEPDEGAEDGESLSDEEENVL